MKQEKRDAWRLTIARDGNEARHGNAADVQDLQARFSAKSRSSDGDEHRASHGVGRGGIRSSASGRHGQPTRRRVSSARTK
jgi:hypothetical protein